jgi:hypothetical protein
MAIDLPTLTGNLKNLKAARRAVVISAADAVRTRLQLSFVLETQLTNLIDQVLSHLNVQSSPDTAPGPILVVTTRIIELVTTPTRLDFVGTSLVVLEDIFLARTFTSSVTGLHLSTTTNTAAEVWSTSDTASVVGEADVRSRLVQDVGRLLDVFAKEWQEANK